ncbi:glycosyltransferase family 1 protein [Domibacillus sp. DTU_2020_1001157_1_SI_ALB_TIR_016]|uniref:glycosyltransferase family 1 protein n=1 Tax=Domibacillus sp. DTU_2020_1001157_1_SI_ALB_TIR_016 TaxID=3077789 RepID=UPI0028EFA123|nr:glycosyltransferase family 1 protein [Domibacillus sp. DTU_2020_1001157_1_SI_ALB_TIR_016]WNS81183.1 glycosyltransferase family 1 protein [Domibacillus sp. DTU_2020_1001157_1_SI_ALB_TIR_016]
MSEPLRVLQVFAEMNRGGAETMIMNLYRNINRSKVQFDFVVHTKNKCAFDDEIRSMGGNIYNVPAYSGRNHFEYKKAWESFFKEHPEYKVIHGHVRSTASIYLNTAKKYGLTTIAHSHNTSSGSGISAFVKNLLQYQIRYIADYLFACSQNAGTWLFGEKACKNDNFFILNNAIEAKKFVLNKDIRDKKRKELQLEDFFVVGHIGRFHPQKNHTFIVDIFKEISEKNSKVKLLLVGEGTLREEIEKKVNNLGLSDKVIFTGVRPDIPELLQAMDVFLFPSLFEGLPVTLVEAQASGIKIFASDTISKEAAITDLINYYSLNSTSVEWANNILKSKYSIKRKNYLSEIENANYDIEKNSLWLEEFYKNIILKQEMGVNNG